MDRDTRHIARAAAPDVENPAWQRRPRAATAAPLHGAAAVAAAPHKGFGDKAGSGGGASGGVGVSGNGAGVGGGGGGAGVGGGGGGGGDGKLASAAAAAQVPAPQVSWLEPLKRPDVVHHKTLAADWRKLHSRWRFLHAVTFWLGGPMRLLGEIAPALVANMALTVLTVADHVSRATSGRAILPDISMMITTGFEPQLRYLLISVSLMQALRLGRAYDRFWTARRGYAAVGSTALALTQRFAAWIGAEQPQLAEDVARWGTIWHAAVKQVLQDKRSIDTRVARLRPDEAPIYAGSRKGRQTAILRLQQLFNAAGLDHVRHAELLRLLSVGVSGQGDCMGIKLQCMPYSLTLLATGFTEIFLLMLPLTALSRSDHGAAPDMHEMVDGVVSAVILLLLLLTVNLLLLSADAVANQLEDPFVWLPLDDILASTDRDTRRALEEARAFASLADPWAPSMGRGHSRWAVGCAADAKENK